MTVQAIIGERIFQRADVLLWNLEYFGTNKLSQSEEIGRMGKCALIIFSKDGFGGAERRLLRVYAKLSRGTQKITVLFHARKSIDSLQLMHTMGIEPSAFQQIKCIYTRRQLIWECISGGYELLHFVDVSSLWTIIMLLARIVGIKTVSTVASVALAQGTAPPKFQTLAAVQWRLANHIDLLYPFCKSRFERRYKSTKITCTPGTFTDLELFRPQKKEKLLLFCAARLEEGKNPLLFVNALARAAEDIRREGYRAIIIGRGQQEEQVRSAIHDARIEDFVEMAGYVAPQDYIVKAQAVFSLHTPNYPSQVVAEACASGCCIIATKCREDPPTFLNEKFALFCEKNSCSLEHTIRRFLSLSEEEKMELGKNARKHAEKHFSVEKSVEYFQNIIENLLKE